MRDGLSDVALHDNESDQVARFIQDCNLVSDFSQARLRPLSGAYRKWAVESANGSGRTMNKWTGCTLEAPSAKVRAGFPNDEQSGAAKIALMHVRLALPGLPGHPLDTGERRAQTSRLA